LLQGYPELEYIIIDGASTDESVRIIKNYEPWLNYWVSEKDSGQPHEINKGLEKSTGEIFNWINSDDLLIPRALERIGAAAQEGRIVAGSVTTFGDEGSTVIPNRSLSACSLLAGESGSSFHQPGLWLRRRDISEAGGIDESLQYAFDFDMFIRYIHRRPLVTYLDQTIAMFRLHGSSKTCSQQSALERDRRTIYCKLLADPNYEVLHDVCDIRVRSYLWWDRLEEVMHSRKPSFLRAAWIAAEMLADPHVRMSRLSLGAIRRALVS
jgi:glycosyltransferase involved in cell wall biosynthesis